jgi:hypothetical protein
MPFDIGSVNDKKKRLGITRELLVQLYWREALSTEDIARRYSTTRATVARWLRHFEVPTRKSKSFDAWRYTSGVSGADYQSRSFEAREIPLTSIQRSFLLGTLCGDGCLKLPRDISSRAYYTGHHGPKQALYLLHKAQLMCPLTSRIYVAPDHSVEVTTISVEELRPWYDSFYGQGQKFLAKWVFEHLDEVGLTYWYLDDGGLNQKHYTINLHGATIYDPVDAAGLLSERFNLPFRVHYSHTNGMRSFYVPTDGAGKFTEILLKHTPESMRWKIHPWYSATLGSV